MTDVHCITPSSLVNGKYTITNDSVGGSLSVECNQGYKSTFTKPITCESSGNWSQPFPTCKGKKFNSSYILSTVMYIN